MLFGQPPSLLSMDVIYGCFTGKYLSRTGIGLLNFLSLLSLTYIAPRPLELSAALTGPPSSAAARVLHGSPSAAPVILGVVCPDPVAAVPLVLCRYGE